MVQHVHISGFVKFLVTLKEVIYNIKALSTNEVTLSSFHRQPAQVISLMHFLIINPQDISLPYFLRLSPLTDNLQSDSPNQINRSN